MDWPRAAGPHAVVKACSRASGAASQGGLALLAAVCSLLQRSVAQGKQATHTPQFSVRCTAWREWTSK